MANTTWPSMPGSSTSITLLSRQLLTCRPSSMGWGCLWMGSNPSTNIRSISFWSFSSSLLMSLEWRYSEIRLGGEWSRWVGTSSAAKTATFVLWIVWSAGRRNHSFLSIETQVCYICTILQPIYMFVAQFHTFPKRGSGEMIKSLLVVTNIVT